MEKNMFRRRLSYLLNDKQRISRIALLIIADILSATIATFMALWVRFDFSIQATSQIRMRDE